jgi:hypothetical protein
MTQFIQEFALAERGQDLVEYSLLITFMALFTLWLGLSGKPLWVSIWGTANTLLTTANKGVS